MGRNARRSLGIAGRSGGVGLHLRCWRCLIHPRIARLISRRGSFGVSLRAVQRVYVTRPPLVGARSVARDVRLDGGPRPAGRHSRARSEVGRARARVDRGLAGTGADER